VWIDGRYEPERRGKRWRDGRWDPKGDGYAFSDGEWVNDDTYPREAPPQPHTERPNARPGFVFIYGRWDWRGGKWEWVDGGYEPERTGKRFRDGRWEKSGDTYGFIEGGWVDEVVEPFDPPARGRRVDRAIVGNFWPVKGKPGSRFVIQGRNFSPDAVVLWDDQPLRAAVGEFEIEVLVPRNAKTGTLTLRDPSRRRDLSVGVFEVVDFDAEAERKRIEEQRKKAAEAAIASRKFAAARAAREAAVRQRAEAYAASREQRRADRIAALRAKWVNEFLASEDAQFELTLHAQRVADLHRMLEIAELKNDVRLAVRIEVLRSREDARHDRRMEFLKSSFKGGKR
jgi:hypothetical protein